MFQLPAERDIMTTFRSNTIQSETNTNPNERKLVLTDAEVHQGNANGQGGFNQDRNGKSCSPYEIDAVKEDADGHGYSDLHMYSNTTVWID